MNPIQIQKNFYRPFCSEEEIDRIFSVSSAEDHLLKLRADAVADHMRYYRVMRRRMSNSGDAWNFTESFHHPMFQEYTDRLVNNGYLPINGAPIPPSGLIYATEANGICMATDFGNLITISESLKYSLYFMNLCYLDLGVEVPNDVRWAAEKIAIRIMLGTESLDFDLDPRGEIPCELDRSLQDFTDKQLLFVLAHEYAHHIMGHLDDSTIIERPLFRAASGGDSVQRAVYSYRQEQEFDADAGAIDHPKYSGDDFHQHSIAALTFLAYIDIFQSVEDQIFPSMPWGKTHPPPLDRFWRIFDRVSSSSGIGRQEAEKFLEFTSIHKKALANDVGFSFDSYENYGSIYLGSWRGPVLVDRVDYYF